MKLKEDILSCTFAELSFGLCQFIQEVRRPNGEKYDPDSILYLCLGIQQVTLGVGALLTTYRTCSGYLQDIHSPTEQLGLYKGGKNVSFLCFIVCLSSIYDSFFWTLLWSQWANTSVLIWMWCGGWVFVARHKYLGLELFGSFFMCRKELLFRNPCFKMEWFRSKIIAQCSSNG